MHDSDFQQILDRLPDWRDRLAAARELLLSNAVMIGEIPAPTYGEAARVTYIKDRFNEAGVQDYSSDEAGNVIAVLPGTGDAPANILVAAHVDTVFHESLDHTVSLRENTIAGLGLADNALGVAAMVTLPDLIRHLGLEFRNNLILLGASRSLGRGNLEGIRFFLEHLDVQIQAGVCIEGVRLGRLNAATIGMLRGEFLCHVPEEYDWTRFGASGAIVTLNEAINRIMEIPLPRRPRTSIVFGSISAGSGYSVIPSESALRFEIRSESEDQVEVIRRRLQDIADEVAAQTRSEVSLDIFAERSPGGIHFSHPLVQSAHGILQQLGVDPRRGPSTAELSALIDRKIPAVTVGLTQCENLNEPKEEVEIAPLFTGLAQLLGILKAIDGGIAMDLDHWIREHTFDYRDFWDLKHLVAAKQTQGLTVSLCIPTLNEEATIAKELVIFRAELMDRYPLLDEIAVIDSGSEDRTLEVAASYGADTYLASEILPECGERRGKGENLWKAIYQLRGDIIVYIDADIKNIHPRFVYGLVAPLIYRPEIKYVKGFYDRPLVVSPGVRTAGGGRVTEILVRPLFSLFFPELTGMIQPLSGEYAVRREVLQEIPFPIGYGVETSHLIDVYSRWGIEAFGQTDLGQRVHFNQPTRALGKMSFGILQTFLTRMRALNMIGDLSAYSTVLRQFIAQDTEYEQVIQEIVEFERPPMVSIPAYREKIGLSPPE